MTKAEELGLTAGVPKPFAESSAAFEVQGGLKGSQGVLRGVEGV